MNDPIDRPYFSVIMPTYNREHLIRETLESVFNQRLTSFETIVVDDGSSDRTCEIVSEFPLVRLIRQQNAGPGSARNAGVKVASGKYIAFLDSDDLWFPWSLGIYHDVITKTGFPAFLAGKPMIFTSESPIGAVSDHPVEFQTFSDYLASGDQWRWYGVSSFVIRRDVFDRSGGFRKGRVNGEDAELALRIGCDGGFVQITSPSMFGYRSHAGNITADLSRTIEAAEHLIQTELDAGFPGGLLRAPQRQHIITRHVRPATLSLLKQRKFVAAIQVYLRILRWHLGQRQWKYLFGFWLLSIKYLCTFRRVTAVSNRTEQ